MSRARDETATTAKRVGPSREKERMEKAEEALVLFDGENERNERSCQGSEDEEGGMRDATNPGG